MIFKAFLVLFALFAISKTFQQFKRKQASLYWFFLWVTFWVVVIFVAFLPQTTDVVATYVGVERGADLLVYIAVVMLSYGLYRTIVQQQKTRHEITKLVREIAILEARKKDE